MTEFEWILVIVSIAIAAMVAFIISWVITVLAISYLQTNGYYDGFRDSMAVFIPFAVAVLVTIGAVQLLPEEA